MCRALVLALFCVGVFCASAFAQKPELVVQTGHTGIYIPHLAFSPDGKMLASAGLLDPNVKIWHTETGKEIISLRASKSPLAHYNAFLWKQNILHISVIDGSSGTNVQYDVGSKKPYFLCHPSTKLFYALVHILLMAP